MWWVRVALIGALLFAAAPGRAETDDQANGGVISVEIDSAIQALRGRVVDETGDMLQLQTTSRQIMVHAPPGFSAPLGACIQVSGQVPLGPIFEAEQASLVPAEDRPAACP
jgi:hypothetical protein